MAEPESTLELSPRMSPRQSPHRLSSAVRSANQSADSASIRSRGRRQASSSNDGNGQETGQPRIHDSIHPSAAQLPTRGDLLGQRSPARSAMSSDRGGIGTSALGQFLGDSLNQTWSSVQGIASSLLASGEGGIGAIERSQAKSWSSKSTYNHWGWKQPGAGNNSSKPVAAWGPSPPSTKPGIDDVAVGSFSTRESALKAVRMASVLESHEGVNGGLDIMGNFKRRTSDEMAPTSSQPEEYLVYIHKVQPTDTYAGLILRYKCRGDAFKKANGLWSNDSIQMRKWLALPVDACELRGRPWEAPLSNQPPIAAGNDANQSFHQTDTKSNGKEIDWDTPWTHVKWVHIASFPEPVEVGRVARQAMGYFSPRRKKSITTSSSVAATTPRQSLDIASPAFGSLERRSSRRHSSLSSQPQLLESSPSSQSPTGLEEVGIRPAWMRRPGGVGSMGQNVHAPGPERDYLNTWMQKHIPSLNIDELPSMSIMGSETARLGFSHDSAGIVESPYKEGRDAVPEIRQGVGFDKAAAAVETWLRDALSRRSSTSFMSSTRGKPAGHESAEGDLIELSDTPGEDVRALFLASSSGRSGARSLENSNQRANAATREVRSQMNAWES